MEMPILSDNAIRQVYNKLKMKPPDWIPEIDKAVAKAQQKEDLGWFVEWGEEPCKNERHTDGWYFYVRHGYYEHKRNCHECFQELKDMAELEGKK
jgi:hypothetical protein